MVSLKGTKGLLLDSSGQARVRVLLWIFCTIFFVYVSCKIVPVYFGYAMMGYEVRAEAEQAVGSSDEEIRKSLLKKAAQWSAPLKEEDILIVRKTRDVEIWVDYTVPVSFFGGYINEFYYYIHVVEPFGKT